MNTDDLCVYKRFNKKQDTLLTFTGPFSQGIIVEIGETILQYLTTKKVEKSKTYDVFSVFVEQTQNIKEYVNHNKNKPFIYDKIFDSGIILIDQANDQYIVSSGNLITKEDSIPLKQKIDALIELNYKELRKLHKTYLKDKNVKNGLGLVEMAKLAKGKIRYSFTGIDEEFLFFSIEVCI